MPGLFAPVESAADPLSLAWLQVGCGFASVVGHVYPIFHGFRGGKGVATLLGSLLALAPVLLLGVLAVWLVMMMLFGYVGLGSMVAAAALPALALWAGKAGWIAAHTVEPLVAFGAACAVFVLWTHRSNIARMRDGTEPRAKRLWLLGRLRK